MIKAKKYVLSEEDEQVWIFCPGCKCHHAFTIKHPTFAPWAWNGSEERPTFSPSMLVNRDTPSQCHSFVTDGKIQFLNDCYHELKGQTVELPRLIDEE